MNRRTYLASIAALGALAGCTESDSGDSAGGGSDGGSDSGSDTTDSGGDSDGSTGSSDGGGDDTDGQSDSQSSDGSGEDGEPQLTTLEPITSMGPPYNDANPDEFSGSGSEVTGSVSLDAGVVVADYQHSGESNFIVKLWDNTDDERHDYLANEIGQADGTSATGVPAGEYSLDVDADRAGR